MTDRELAGCALRCPCTPDDPMAVFVSRCIEPMQMRGELYVVCCRWCGDNAPFVFVGRGASDLNRDAIAAWNRRAPSRDEVRYRWLRLRLAGAEHVAELVEFNTGMHPELPGNVDAAIDAAIAAAAAPPD